GEVRVRLRGAEPPVLFLNLVHATRAGFDVRLRLERAPDGGYAAPLPALAAGHWRAVVDDPRGEWRVVQEFL
ncbi:MAG: FixH family protein, partial [Betaproteobacteria bacterium]